MSAGLFYCVIRDVPAPSPHAGMSHTQTGIH